MSKIWSGLVCAGLLLAGPAQAADLSKVGPLASAESLINARAQFREDGIEFAVDIKGGDRPGTWSIDLAPDFITVFDGNVKSTTYDYALKRVILLDDGAHSIVNTSLYGMVDFRVAESANRRILGRIVSGAGLTKNAPIDAFWTQSELHVVDSADGAPNLVRKAAKDGAAFSHNGANVASYSLAAQTLKKDESARLSQYLIANTTLHPAIIAEIVASGRMPAHISYALSPILKSGRIEMAFKPALPVKAVYVLRKGEKVEPFGPRQDPLASTLQGVMQVMIAATAGQAPGLRKPGDYRAAIETALAGDHGFQALILMFEMTEQYGDATLACAKPDGCHSGAQIVAAAKADPRTQALVGALQPKTKEEGEAAIKALAAMKRDDLSNPYVIDDFLANNLAAAGRIDDALPLFAAAIKGNPYMAGYYKDMGDAYRTGFDPDLAWFCYDVGRTLPGGPNAPVIKVVNDTEARMEANYPQFF
ncbi:MAG TPA: hypothetical protein VGF56_10310 [Rhizomicrobium sp.]|jgi:hypothetical protein